MMTGQGIQVLSKLLDSISLPLKTEGAQRRWRELVVIFESHPLCATLRAGRRDVESSKQVRETAELAGKKGIMLIRA